MSAPSPSGVVDLGAFAPADGRAGTLSRRGTGSVLEADVAGFTPLTERLSDKHGPRRGAEEIAALLNGVYGALIAEAEACGGVVVEFLGDAILCCFDGDDGTAALRCGLRMQLALAALRAPGDDFPAVKVAVGVGAFQRLSVGDPAVRLHEVVTGRALDELLLVAPLAERGEVVIGTRTARDLGARVIVRQRRRGPTGDGAECAIVGGVTGAANGLLERGPRLDDDAARAWLGATVLARLQAGGETMLSELRSVVALFVRFDGVDYSEDGADERLDRFVRFAQSTIEGFGGLLLNLAVDTKGSYLCAGFGAVIAHDDDPQRAAAAALTLLEPAASPVAVMGIGLAAGRVYAGTYGGSTRRAFGVQGTQVNLAARLMQAARGRQILVEEPLARQLVRRFELGPRRVLDVKGRSAPIAVRDLVGAARSAAPAAGAVPELVGRSGERARLEALARALADGRGGVVLLEGEPGIGKSRLASHLADSAAALGASVLTGAGDPIECGAPYHGWRAIFGDGIDPRIVATDGDARAEATRDLLMGLLEARAAVRPTLVLLEDAHWLDSASLTLALRLASTPDAVLLALTTRPLAEASQPELARIAELPELVHLRLGPLAAGEATALAAGAVGGRMPASAVALIEHKAGGNPLFSRELAFALRDQGLLDAGRGNEGRLDDRIAALDSPDTVEAVIAGRVDRMPSEAQAVLKVASVLGPSFSAQALRRLAGTPVDAAVGELERHELLVAAAPTLSFKHALIRDVVYQRLLHSQRRALHRSAAEQLEGDGVSAATLAHHWDRAEVPERAAAWLGEAGEQAMRVGAARECVTALERALELTRAEGPGGRRARWTYSLAHAHYRLGDVDRSITWGAAAIAALDRPIPEREAGVIGAVLREAGRQLARLAGGRAAPRERPDAAQRLVAESVFAMGEVYYAAADKPRSIYVALRSLNLAERHGPSPELAACYGAMGIISGLVGVHPLARRYAQRSQATSTALGDPVALALTSQQVGWYGVSTGPYAAFREPFADAIERCRQLAHKPRLRDALGCGGIGDLLFGRHDDAHEKLTSLLATAEPQERAIWVLWGPLFLAALALRVGHEEEALSRVRETERRARPENMDLTEFLLGALAAVALWRLGRDEEAARYERESWVALRRVGRLPTTHAELPGRAALAEIALARLDAATSPAEREDAWRDARRACAALRTFARVFAIGAPVRLLYEAELRQRREEPQRALRTWRRALDAAERLDMRYEQALAHVALADHLTPASPDAVRHRELAAEALAALGVLPSHRAVASRRAE